MQIYVCVKHVPDSAANIVILDNIRIDENLSFLLNPYDEHAVTEAVRVKERLLGSEIIAVCLGKADAEKTIRSAMAMGADRGILIVSDKHHDSMETAKVLKAAIEQDGTPQLILTGKESIDAEGMQTMFRIGALFDFPVATNVVKLDIAGDRAVVDCDLSCGICNTYEMTCPCVIGAGRGLNTPRYPTFPDVVKSKKKPVKIIAVSDLVIKASTSAMTLVAYEPLLQKRVPKKITGDCAKIAEKIVKILREEAKVI
ncbi:MAG: electron transfer flavoprotein subunit beta/FixA family protein [Proteobacteria bacterium]|nr:electron transfer flavoprotein subunit beta/FixA family protein [Pseudomonadota bacterium]MBU1581508.1 electron transfer flavoprotein subunit beta/FixA family protein [Pseudomonadota bacterium]MBU2454706.1 electron transfer flavoprotein subunit beta/FixA family protein [Pseudomonadota bacterium]MBU2628080.1 electron transfer flavoprotein subunit beta/FixA family protein [Pseudomonadota bacterium]